MKCSPYLIEFETQIDSCWNDLNWFFKFLSEVVISLRVKLVIGFYVWQRPIFPFFCCFFCVCNGFPHFQSKLQIIVKCTISWLGLPLEYALGLVNILTVFLEIPWEFNISGSIYRTIMKKRMTCGKRRQVDDTSFQIFIKTLFFSFFFLLWLLFPAWIFKLKSNSQSLGAFVLF